MEFRDEFRGENGVTSFFEQISPSRLGRGKMVLPLFFFEQISPSTVRREQRRSEDVSA